MIVLHSSENASDLFLDLAILQFCIMEMYVLHGQNMLGEIAIAIISMFQIIQTKILLADCMRY